MTGTSVYLATCFDAGYASRAKVLLNSASNGRSLKIEILFLGHDFDQVQSSFPEAGWTDLSSFLAQDAKLNGALSGRSWPEQIFTMGPTFLLKILEKLPQDAWLVYADSDIWFQVPVDEYLQPFDQANVVITRHRHYSWNKKRLAKYGEFNVGVVAFRNNKEGRKVLQKWADACIEWCKDRPESGKYADQKYLESFFDWGHGVVVDERVGANLGPWNASFKKIRLTGSTYSVGGEKPLFFHMQGLRKIKDRWFLGHLNYLSFAGPKLKKNFYKPYLELLEKAQSDLAIQVKPSSVRKSFTGINRVVGELFKLASLLLNQTIKLENRS
jgi:hypothetical protein